MEVFTYTYGKTTELTSIVANDTNNINSYIASQAENQIVQEISGSVWCTFVCTIKQIKIEEDGSEPHEITPSFCVETTKDFTP